jgi:hypothetical protein
MFWYTLIKTSELQRLRINLEIYIKQFEEQVDKVGHLLYIRDKHIEHNANLWKKIEELTNDIPHWGYLTAPISNKNRSDAFIKKEALKYLPVEYTEDMIYDFLIDRKQGKMVILIK